MADGALVEARRVRHNYRGVLALDDVSLALRPGSFTALLGPNGAGKSTLAQVLTGLLRPTQGEVLFDGKPAKAKGSMVRGGICLVPEGRRLFGELTIAENLVVAGYAAGVRGAALQQRMAAAAAVLPEALRSGMAGRHAATLSGGERQIVAIARALMSDPRLVILDEPSMGLAPIMTDRVYEILAGLQQKGVAVVVVEQIATHALEHADMLYLLSRGRIVYSGPPSDEASREVIRSSYVGEVAE